MTTLSFRRVAALLLVVGAGAVAHATVTATPSEVAITSPSQTVKISLSQDGKPLPASAIKGYTFNAENHTYEHMITMAKHDGGVDITPTKEAQVGVYDFTIKTSGGDVLVNVNMPLSDMPDTLENRAKAMGISVEELDKRLGLSKPYGRETVTFTFPGPYYPGSVLTMETPCPADRQYEWRVNGQVVKSGTGPEQFSYTFPTLGTYVIGYRDMKDGAPVASGKAVVTVVEKPADTK